MVVFLPIKPKFAFPILDGVKRFEFRKSAFKKEIKKVVVYASSPHQRILGFFDVKAIHKSRLWEAWRKFGKHGSISKKEYSEYFKGKEYAISIEVGKIVRFTTPMHPQEVFSADFKVPQSYTYLNPSRFQSLLRTQNKMVNIFGTSSKSAGFTSGR